MTCVVFISASLEGFWTDSEMWAAVVVKYMFHNNGFYSFAIKPIFNLFLWINYQWALSLDLHPMVTGRFTMALNGLLCAFLVSKIVGKATKNSYAGFIAFFFLLAFSTFIKRGGNIRSDMLVTTFILLGLYFRIFYSSWMAMLLSLTLWIGALLISPKAVFFSVPLILHLFAKKYLNIKTVLLIVLSLLATITVLLIVFGKEVFDQYLTKSILFFLHSFGQEGTGLSYFDSIRFVHVFRFLKENIALFLAFILFVLVSKKGQRIKYEVLRSEEGKLISNLGLVSFFIFIFYPDRLPFLIAGLLPFFVLFLSFLFSSLWTHTLKSWLFILFCTFSSMFWAQDICFNHSNREQRIVSDWVDQQFLTLPELKIWDPTGILVKAPAQYLFLGPAQDRDNYQNIYFIKDGLMDVFLYTSKAFYLEPELSVYLRLKYTNAGAGIYIRNDLDQVVSKEKLESFKKQLALGLKDQLLTKLFRFDFEY